MEKYDLAMSILGDDFISPLDVMNSRKGITYTDEQLAMFCETIPAQEILELCRDKNFMLVAGPNRLMSLLEIRDLENDYFYTKEGKWNIIDESEDFINSDFVRIKWYMICKVPILTYKNLDEQYKEIQEEQFVPNCAEFAWAITTYKAVRDIYLFSYSHARTSSRTKLLKDRVTIGNFSKDGLRIGLCWRRANSPDLALSIAVCHEEF